MRWKKYMFKKKKKKLKQNKTEEKKNAVRFLVSVLKFEWQSFIFLFLHYSFKGII